ncbi:unnamed protein product [Camellia sinensis]
MEKLGHQRLTCLLVAWLTLLVQIFFIHAADCSQHNGLYRSSENINQQILFDIDPFGQHLGIGSEVCKALSFETTVSLSLSRRRATSGKFWFGRATSRTMILDKGQLLETEQMFCDAGEQWPVIIPEEEIRQAAPGTKDQIDES